MDKTITATRAWLDLMSLINSIPEPLAREMSTMAISGWLDANQLQRFGRVARLAANLEIRLLFEQGGQPLAHERMIVHQENSNFLRHEFQKLPRG